MWSVKLRPREISALVGGCLGDLGGSEVFFFVFFVGLYM
jgi:hypothetical protein